MKLFKIIALSILAAIPIFGMEKQPESWKAWLFGTPIAPIITEKFSNTSAKESETLLGFLHRELREELKKFITHDKKSAQAFWALKQAQEHNFNQKTLTGPHTGYVFSLAYSSTAHQLYSGSSYHNIKIWDLNTNKCITNLTDNRDTIYSLAYNPTKNQLYSGCADNTIKIWDLNTYTCIATLTGNTSGYLRLFMILLLITLFRILGCHY